MRKILAWRPDVLVLSLWAIVVGGTIVRFVGLDFGLPLTIKSDEGLVVDTARGMVERRSFEPGRFEWPNHLGIMATYLAFVFITPLWHGMLVEQAINEVEIGYFHLIARGVTAAFGVATIFLAYYIGKRFHKIVGVFAAALFAFMPHYVEESHYATPDVPLTAAVLAVVLAAMVYVNKPTMPMLLVMSLMTTLSIMAKYPGALGTVVIAAVVIAAAIRDRAWLRIPGHGIISALSVGVFLFILTPEMFTNRHVVLRRITNEARGTHLGADGLTFTEKLGFYAGNYFGYTGVIILVFSIAGVWFVIKNWRLDAIPLFIGGVFWVALSTLGLHWARWGLPMYITPLLLAALGAYFLLNLARSATKARRAATIGFAVVGGFALVTQVLASVATTGTFLREDTRQIALKDFDTRGITDQNTIYEGYTPFRARWFDTIFDDVVVRDGTVNVRDPDVRYVLLSSSMYGRFMAESERFPRENLIYELLDKDYELITTYRAESPGVSFPFSNIRAIAALQSLANTNQGATGGPTMKLYSVPNQSR